MKNPLYLIAVILVIAWAVAFLGYQANEVIHIILFIAAIAIILGVVQGKEFS
jgi:predicted ferric reductase